jgi:hypothetical protein
VAIAFLSFFCIFEAFKRVMRKLIPENLAIILSGLILFSLSCTPGSCLEETTSFLNATFYKTGSNLPTVTDSLTIFGIRNGTTSLYTKALKVSVIKLPLDASSETCGFVLKINNITDTLNFTYSVYPHLISKECGITFYYNLNSYQVSGNTIDSISIRNSNITTLNVENIRIFY